MANLGLLDVPGVARLDVDGPGVVNFDGPGVVPNLVFLDGVCSPVKTNKVFVMLVM